MLFRALYYQLNTLNERMKQQFSCFKVKVLRVQKQIKYVENTYANTIEHQRKKN